MAEHVKLAARSGGETRVEAAKVAQLGESMRGQLLQPEDQGYEEARQLWNAMVDRRPGLIARCSGVTDIRRALEFARDNDLVLAIRGGGHNIAGNASCEGGMVIDLSSLRTVRVDPVRQRAAVGPGARLGDVDHETLPFGLAVPTGINSTTGVAGLTLGGGFGWLSRRYGLTIDSLLSADVITADGELVRASAEENPDLFFAIRGGGGNFGIVTEFDFQLQKVGPNLLSGLVVYPFDEGQKVLARYRELTQDMPDELSAWVVLRKAPPLPFLPDEVHGKEVVVIAMCYTGDPARGEKAAKPLRGLGTVLGEHIDVMPFAGWQQAFDPLLTPGARNYWKSHNFTSLTAEATDLLLGHASRLPSPHCEIFVGQLGGQINRVAKDATAYPHRDINYVLNVHARWETPQEDEQCIAWAREIYRTLEPHAKGGAYINFMTEEEGDARLREAYGDNFDRLAAVKKKYDPDNLFRLNHNIPPRR